MTTGSVTEEPYVDQGPGSGAPEFAVVDIGGDIGALIVHASEACIGRELDLTRVGEPRSHHVHLMIRRRRLVSGEVFAGLCPELQEGRYIVWGVTEPLGEVEVVGGAVAEFDAGDCGRAESRA